MPESNSVPALPGTYLGFDFGLKRIGIACGNSITQSSMPLITVSNLSGTPEWTRVDEIVAKWQPVGLVVGYPVHMDGTLQTISHHAAGFAKRLKRRYDLSVYLADERLTSRLAEDVQRKNRSTGAGKRTGKENTDRIAAALLLSDWLETRFQT